MPRYLLALDQGTTSSRAILFDQRCRTSSRSAQKEFTQYYPQSGWVEHNPMEIYSSIYGVMMEVISQSDIHARDIAAIGITNQRETTVVWDKTTGQPIYNAIVWQCRRTASICDELDGAGLGTISKRRRVWCWTRIFPARRSSGFWTMSTARRNEAERGDLLFGTVDTWLIWKLTGRARYMSPTTPTPPAPCSMISTDSAGTNGFCRSSGFQPRCCLRCAIPPRSTARATFRACRCRSRALRATSRRRCSVSAALHPAMRKTPTARAAFCS